MNLPKRRWPATAVSTGRRTFQRRSFSRLRAPYPRSKTGSRSWKSKRSKSRQAATTFKTKKSHSISQVSFIYEARPIAHRTRRIVHGIRAQHGGGCHRAQFGNLRTQEPIRVQRGPRGAGAVLANRLAETAVGWLGTTRAGQGHGRREAAAKLLQRDQRP